MSDHEEKQPYLFSEAAFSEATTLEGTIETALLGRDEVSGITIAGPFTNACNTAIWIKRTIQGGFTLLFSIVDVGTFVTPHATSALENEAKARIFAQYASENEIIPLLPVSLSEGSLSLLEGRACPTITLSIPIATPFQIGEPSFRQKTFVRSRKRLTYEEIDLALADEQQSALNMVLQDAFHLAVNCWLLRMHQGAMVSYDLETGWVTTEDGVRILLAEDKRYKGYIIEQEMSILANQLIASFLERKAVPALYRNLTLPRVAKAIYAPTIDGHAGLNLSAYIHAVLPLRSYPDLVNQRVLLASLREEPSPYTLKELEALAIPLNAKEAVIKAAKRGHFRGEHDEHLQKRLEEEPLESLSQKHFHSVIRKAAEDHLLTSAIVQEIHRRLEQHLLKDNDLYVLLFGFQKSGEEWEQVKHAVCLFLLENSSQAVMLYNRGKQSGRWELLRDVPPTDLGGYFQAQVTLQFAGREYASSSRLAHRKAEARQRAIADALACIAGVFVPPDGSLSEE